MPTTAVQLALFLALLAPGFAYRFIRDRAKPSEARSTLTETAQVVLVSALADSLSVSMFGIVRVILPRRTLRVGAFVQNPEKYFKAHYVEALLTGLTILAVSCSLAIAFARLRPVLEQSRVVKWIVPFPGEDVSSSAWWSTFHHKDDRVFAQCYMSDGAYIQGYVYSFSRSMLDSGDRDLVLSGEVKFRPAGCEDLTDMPNSRAVLSAGKIALVLVTYVRVAKCSRSISAPTAGASVLDATTVGSGSV